MFFPRYQDFSGYLMVLLLFVFLAPASAQNTASSPSTAGDNSKVNQRDQSQSEPTADQQKNNSSDLQISKQIRHSLIQDKSLSTYAHNVKVITQSGKVTLKGPVRSDDEKAAVVDKAAQVAGATNVNDEMTVVPKHN